MKVTEIGHHFPLSLSQYNIWKLECAMGGTSVNNISTTIRIRGRVDFVVLGRSIGDVIRADATLRTRILLEDGVPLQYHAPHQEEDFPVYDFSGADGEGIGDWEAAVTRERIPVTEGPLYRFQLFREDGNSGGVLVKVHHIISDGWSQVLLCNRIGKRYLELLSGEGKGIEEVPDYELHVSEEQEYLSSAAYSADARYWKAMLERSGEPSVLKVSKTAVVSPVGRRLSFELPQVLNHAIYSFCVENQVSPFAVFYMALAVYLKRTGGGERFTIGVPVTNRTSYRFKRTTGMFVATLPFYNEINEEWTLREFNRQLTEAWYELLRRQRFPFAHIEELAREKRGQEGRLFHIALSYQDSKIFESRDSSVFLSGSWHYSGYQSEQLCIHLTDLYGSRCYRVDYDYLIQLFEEAEIGRLHNSLCSILLDALEHQEKPLHQLAILTTRERERVLYAFNRTDRAIADQTLQERLNKVAAAHPNRVALISGGRKMTYAVLSRRAEGVAGRITGRGGLAAVLLPRTFELLEAMIGILKGGSAYLLLDPGLPAGRIGRILKRSGADMLITDRETMAGTCLASEDCPAEVLFMEDVMTSESDSCRPAAEDPGKGAGGAEELAYVVYTSGSTGEPKGVEITCGNLLNLSQAMGSIYGNGAVLSVCGVGFDAFVLESIAALLNGRTIVLPTEEELESPRRLAGLIRDWGVGFFAMTPSRLNAFLKEPSFREALERMESIVCGGEAFSPELLKQLQICSHARIYNQYGPSETTVGVSIRELTGAGSITAGRPMDNCRLYVLDKRGNPLPVGVYGELYVGGRCVGKGYRNDPLQTQKCFLPSPFESGERIYRTGDAACWTQEGEILLAGRLDQQVKIRGLRVEPQEAASCIASHPLVREAAAKVWETDAQPALAVYYCSGEEVQETQLLTYAASFLPQYMIPSYLIRLERLPMSDSGKVQEDKLPKPGTAGRETAVLGHGQDCESDVEETAGTIVSVFRKVLEKDNIDVETDYFLAGGDSLNAMAVIAALEELTGRTIRVSDLYACRSAGRLAQYLWGKRSHYSKTVETGVSSWLQHAPVRDRYELSAVQQGIYVQSYLDPTGLAYNMPGAFRLSKEPDKERLQEAFRSIIARDRILRTAFMQEGEAILACVRQEVTFDLGELKCRDFEEAARTFAVPFDLSRAPLFRAALWQEKTGGWYLFMDSHHIIGDGMSTPLLLKRLDDAYGGRALMPEFDYYDYVYTLAGKSGAGEGQDYWKGRLASLPQALELPTDYTRPRSFDYKGKEYRHMIGKETGSACKEYSRRRGISPYMLFLGAYGLLLSRISGREELVLGVPAAGRIHPGTMHICGPFINTLPVRLAPEGSKSVEAYLEEVRSEVAGMLDHQQTPLEEIITMLNLPRGAQNPLYRMMFSQSPVDTEAFVLNGRPMEYRPVSTGTAKMDLTAELSSQGDNFCVAFTYGASLFLEETIQFYGRCLERILTQMISGEGMRLEKVAVLSAADQERYVDIPNYSTTPFVNLPIHRLIENKAGTMPQAPAVVYHGRIVTRQELDRRACGMAAALCEAGVRPGECVGLGFARTPDIFAAMLGILKAGCAYMPFLPSFPEARLDYMLKTAGAKAVLCDEDTAAKMPDSLTCRIITNMGRQEGNFVDFPVGEEDLVNVMFTSGSTGKPKGVMLKHRAVSSLFVSIRELLERAKGPVLCTTNVVFDSFIGESLFPLAMGKTVVLADEEEMMLPWKLADIIRDSGAQIFQVTPARLQMCLGNDAFCQAAASLKLVLLGGEVLTPGLLARLHEVTEAVSVNMYGPTEATVYMTMTDVEPGDHITIGRPLYNSRIYVLDEKGRPVMPTACGELYMAGECLARGYISRPDLTEQAFLPDPFFPGERMYRSGDMGRLRLDGTYDFLGRRDSQVKMNGQRVELDEITGAILESGCALQGATVAVRRQDGSMELCSFYQPVPGETGQPHRLRECLKRTLPAYMVPSGLIPLEQMPLTPSSKIDLQALKKMAENGREESAASECGAQQIHAEPMKSEGRTVTTDFILTIWGQVLGRKDLEPDVSFFEQGGTSLAALSVLGSYFNEHLEMTLAQFYENPAARQQAALLSVAAGEIVVEKDLEQSVTAEPAETGVCTPDKSGAVLLTGATGFLGAHLLKALLDRDGIRKIICILRDGSRERLFDCLDWYFGRAGMLRESRRIVVVKGDLGQPQLGLDGDAYQELVRQAGEIFHAAADVRHYAADTQGYLRTNVEGTRQMLALAEEAGAPFYYMSTCSIGGEELKEQGRTAVFTERDYDIGQRWEDNIYVKSKFLAEGLVMDALKKGLTGKIFRLGRLVGRASDGVFQRNPDTNVFYLLMRAFCLLEVMPRSAAGQEVDLTPVDYCAEAILALRQQRGPVFHIMHPCPPTAGQTAKAMGSSIEVVEDGRFQAILEKAARGPWREALLPLLDYWQRLRLHPPAVRVTCAETVKQLAQAGFDFPIPPADRLLGSFPQQESWIVKGE